MARPSTSLAVLVLSAQLLAVAHAQSCSAASPTYCFYPGVPPSKGGNTTVYAYPMSSFSPSVNNAACSCISYGYINTGAAADSFGCAPGASCTAYSFADAGLLSSLASAPGVYTNLQSCTTDLCNCHEPGCVDPYTPGACPATGSAGPLKCRMGYIGALDGTTYTAATPGNLATQTFPAGSICYKYMYSGLTVYTNLTAAACVDQIRMGGIGNVYTGASGCNTDLCGAPAPTWTGGASAATPVRAQALAVLAAAVAAVAMF